MQKTNHTKRKVSNKSKISVKPPSQKEKSLKALLIEDNYLVQYLHSNYLEKLNYTVQTAGSQQEALHYAFYQRYDLLIVDIGLADNRSEAIISNLREPPSLNQKTPLLVVTSFDNSLLQSRCLKAGANEYLLKPLSKTQLENTLKKLINPKNVTLFSQPIGDI